MWVRSLGREDPLEKEMVTHYRIRAWESPWTEEPGGLQSMGSQESDTTEQLNSSECTPGVISHPGRLPPGSLGWAWMMSVPEGKTAEGQQAQTPAAESV